MKFRAKSGWRGELRQWAAVPYHFCIDKLSLIIQM